MRMFNKKFSYLYTFYVTYVFIHILAFSLSYLYFIEKGLSYIQILIGDFIVFASVLIGLLIFKRLLTKAGLMIAIIFSIMQFLILYNLTSQYQFYISRVLLGLNLIFFSVCYNISHFRLTKKSDIGLSSGLMFAIGPIIGILIPGFKGFIVEKHGFEFIFIIAVILELFLFYILTKVESYKIEFSIVDLLKKLKGLRLILFFEGLVESVPFSIIPLVTLLYIKTPIKLGLFSSYLAIIGFIGNLIFGKISDAIKNRKWFLYILTSLLSLSVIGLGFSWSIYSWAIFTGLVGLLLTLSWPFMTALVVDKYPKVEESMISREFILNFGRTFGLMIFIATFSLFDNIYLALIIIGLLFLIYPLLIKINKIYK